MKQIILILIITLSLTVSAQKKDSVKPAFEISFVFTEKDIESIKSILMESKVFINGIPQPVLLTSQDFTSAITCKFTIHAPTSGSINARAVSVNKELQ